jgi:hypothetical protein
MVILDPARTKAVAAVVPMPRHRADHIIVMLDEARHRREIRPLVQMAEVVAGYLVVRDVIPLVRG